MAKKSPGAAAERKPSRAKSASPEVRAYLAGIGSIGGQARVPKGTATLSEKERKRRASEAAKARWAKKIPVVVLAIAASLLAISARRDPWMPEPSALLRER